MSSVSDNGVNFEGLKRQWRAEKNSIKRFLASFELKLNVLKKDKNDPLRSVPTSMLGELDSSLKQFHKTCMSCIEAFDVSGKTEAEILKFEDDTTNGYDSCRMKWCELRDECEVLMVKTGGGDRKSILADSVEHSGHSNRSNVGFKLPDITIPKFSGDLRTYCDWAALFENMIHRNDRFEPIQKLYYLKSALLGDAAEILVDTPLNEAAYATAWSEVKRNFDNKRAIIAAHFSDLVGLKLIKNESEIRCALRKVSAAMRGLSACGIEPEPLSPLISYLVSTKLDPNLRRDWEKSIKDNSRYPTFQELETHLKSVSFAYESCLDNRSSKTEKASEDKPSKRTEKIDKKSFLASRVAVVCSLCKGNHFLAFCDKFLAKNVTDRYQTVKQLRACPNCLKQHGSKCYSVYRCKVCNKFHNTTLHRYETQPESTADKPVASQTSLPSSEQEKPKSTMTAVAYKARAAKVKLLPTAVVHLIVNNQAIKVRVLIDPCSQANLISESLVKKYRISTARVHSCIAGISNEPLNITRTARLTIKSRINEFSLSFDADVVPKIPYEVPPSLIQKIVTQFGDFTLADEGLQSGEVDLLIGVDYSNVCLLGKKQEFNGLWLEESPFGLIASGPVNSSAKLNVKHCNLTIDIEDQLKKFWTLEEVEPHSEALDEREACNQHFEATVKRLANGQFSVSLPFKREKQGVANTYAQACLALRRSEKRLDLSTREKYINFMTEYEALGHMEVIPADKLNNSPNYYLPHHAVLRPESSTTSCRVVYNGSAKNSSGYSLNEALYIGPVLQLDLFDLILKFRVPEVAFTADIAKMYRCIMVSEEDRDMQRIVWRKSPAEEIRHYRLTTLTYGTGPASYIATKCLQLKADEIREELPEAARSISEEFYMDDWLSGADNVEAAVVKQQAVHRTLAEAHMHLRKYSSNSAEFLAQLEPQLRGDQMEVLFGENTTSTSVLGMRWATMSDTFSLKIDVNFWGTVAVPTKRSILSFISRVFDPLGLFSPVTIAGKLLIQDLWREGISWDDALPDRINKKFECYKNELKSLKSVVFPRRFYNIKPETLQLVGFCDASSKAYSATVYLRTVDSCNRVNVALVCSKTRVAPVKEITIPRLEMLGAVLLTKLLTRVRTLLKVSSDNIFAFCDSTIALSWIRNPREKCDIFVKNRASFIEANLPATKWNYVESGQNPADLCTRGVGTSTFCSQLSFWMLGPTWLINDFPNHVKTGELSCCHPETTTITRAVNIITSTVNVSFIENFSSFNKCINSVAYMYRFIFKASKSKVIPRSLDLLTEEREFAFNKLIKLSQEFYFSSEIECLTNNKPIKKCSPLKSLNIFFDNNRLLRVGGRLSQSNYSFDIKHPIIISQKSAFLKLYICYIHLTFFHATKSFVANIICGKYWIIGGSNKLIKSIIYKCVVCARLRAEPGNQIMGDLPCTRTNVSRPFTNVGVDYAGWFRIKCTGHRSTKFNKIYAAFFVCLVTKAVHIEIASDLSASSFLSAFDRFRSRRGWPVKMISDNATNFVSASKMLVSSSSLKWEFNPPRSPHFGGIFESAIKSGKSLLVRAIGSQVLNQEEFLTIFTRIEGVLNSRPLCRLPASGTADNFEPLTPAHLLIGSSLQTSDDTIDSNPSLPRRHLLLRSIISSFWHRWRHAYLAQLQRRQKWTDRFQNLAVGDVVVVKDAQTLPMEWPMGIVEAVFPDKNGDVRVCTLRTTKGVFRRSVHGLVQLPQP